MEQMVNRFAWTLSDKRQEIRNGYALWIIDRNPGLRGFNESDWKFRPAPRTTIISYWNIVIAVALINLLEEIGAVSWLCGGGCSNHPVVSPASWFYRDIVFVQRFIGEE